MRDAAIQHGDAVKATASLFGIPLTAELLLKLFLFGITVGGFYQKIDGMATRLERIERWIDSNTALKAK